MNNIPSIVYSAESTGGDTNMFFTLMVFVALVIAFSTAINYIANR